MKFKISLALFLSLFTATTFAQKDEKQLSLEFVEHIKNAQYHEAYTMFDSAVLKKINQDAFITAMQGANKQLGDIESYTYEFGEKGKEHDRTFTKCQFKNNTLDIELAFSPNGRIDGFHFVDPAQVAASKYTPPSYDSVAGYTEIKITINTGIYKLPGILTVPNTIKNPPVVVMVQGSGPNDMDESIGSNKPFKDLAIGLVRKGIATIRYEKRTLIYGVHMAVDIHKATVNDEVIDDVLSAVNMAGSLGCDTNRIFVLGHSLGAMLAPRIAAQSKKIHGIIMMAGDSRSLEDVMIDQYKYLASLDTASARKNKQRIDDAIKQAKYAESPDLKPDAPDSLLPLGVPAPYWIDINHYNQVKTAEALTLPIFILQGERDYQVTMDDYNLWKDKLHKKKNVTLKSYPKLNHLFMEGEGKKSTPAEYDKQSHVPMYVIDDIATWLNKN